MRIKLLAAAIALIATHASATTLNITSVGLYHYDYVNISGTLKGYGPYNVNNALAGPILIEGTTAAGKPFSAVTFCFDVVHEIYVALNGQYAENLTYSTAKLATDNTTGIGTGNPLTWRQQRDISGLAQLGANDFVRGTGDIANEGPAIQAAIWHIEDGLTITFRNPTETALYNGYIHEHFTGTELPALLAINAQGQVVGATQGQALGQGTGVGPMPTPEPGSLALLLGGVALAGTIVRRRRG